LLVKPSFHDGNLFDNLERINHDYSCPDYLICLLIYLTIHDYDHNIQEKYIEFYTHHHLFSEKDSAIILYIFEGLTEKINNTTHTLSKLKHKLKFDVNIYNDLYAALGKYRGIKGYYIMNKFILIK